MKYEVQIEYLSLADIVVVAERTLGDCQIREPSLLASAVARPQMSAFGQDAYPLLPDKAAALMHSLARNHAFVDGNERVAWVATKLFLALNGERLIAPSVDEGEQLVLEVARGELEGLDLSKAVLLWMLSPSAR